MRNPERILKILERIEKIWKENPELRLGQLLCNAINIDYLYEIEDDKLINFLRCTYEKVDTTT